MTPRRWLMGKKYNRCKKIDADYEYNINVKSFILLYEELLNIEEDMKAIDVERKALRFNNS